MEFILREWKVTDAPGITLYANNIKIARNLRNAFPYPYTLEDAESYIESVLKGDPAKVLQYAIDVNGEAVGSIGVFVKDDVYCKTAEIGYWLGEPFWGNGIMSKAIGMISDIAFDRFDIVRLYAEPFAVNDSSCRALEKAGFQLEGVLKKNVFKLGEILDTRIYAKVKEKEE